MPPTITLAPTTTWSAYQTAATDVDSPPGGGGRASALHAATYPVVAYCQSHERMLPVVRSRRGQVGGRSGAGGDVRCSAQLVSVTQDGDRVIADALVAGEHVSGHASYMVAADGAHGRTRDGLGSDRSGPGTLGHRLSILVNANLGARMMERQ